MNKNFLHSIGFAPTCDFEKIQKGGSTRAFFRFTDEKLGNLIFCEYSDEREENFLYSDIAEFLHTSGINVPKIFFHDTSKRILIMQDVGKIDLLDFCKNSTPQNILSFYKKTLLNVAHLHQEATTAYFKHPIKLMPQFNDALYDWEQNYFFENLIKNHLKLNVNKPQSNFKKIKSHLKTENLIHRDFQSQNVIVNENEVFFIDFQGMRLGSFWYDLGSLLFDPYVDNLTDEIRQELLNYYCQIRKIDFDKNAFYIASSQRLMQALGAYAFLSDVKNKREYLNYILPALKNLKICAENAGLNEILEIAQLAEKRLEK